MVNKSRIVPFDLPLIIASIWLIIIAKEIAPIASGVDRSSDFICGSLFWWTGWGLLNCIIYVYCSDITLLKTQFISNHEVFGIVAVCWHRWSRESELYLDKYGSRKSRELYLNRYVLRNFYGEGFYYTCLYFLIGDLFGLNCLNSLLRWYLYDVWFISSSKYKIITIIKRCKDLISSL